MNKYFFLGFRIFPLFFFGLAIFLTSTQAQDKSVPKKFSKNKSSKNLQVKSKNTYKIMSAGVLNGKAIRLVRPAFPKAARMVNVYGAVSVKVLIDENGNVAQASAVKGHPLLHSPSIKAAFESNFEPLTLSGQPVKLEGIIIYKFIPDKWNWLEIGYTLNCDSHSYYSIKTLLEVFPFGWQTEREILSQILIVPEESRTETKQTAVSIIRQRLLNQTKILWLFDLGLALAEIKKDLVEDTELLKTSESFQNLKLLVQNHPADVHQTLIEKLQKIILLIEEDNDKSFEELQKFEDIFPYVGN